MRKKTIGSIFVSCQIADVSVLIATHGIWTRKISFLVGMYHQSKVFLTASRQSLKSCKFLFKYI